MCLSYLTKFKVYRNYGYKYLHKIGDEYHTPLIWSKPFKKNEIAVNNDNKSLRCLCTGKSYRGGFHIYYSKKEALKSWIGSVASAKLYKVKFTDYITGTGDGSSHKIKIIVSQKMLIMEECR